MVAAAHGIPQAVWDASALIADPEIDIVDITVRPPIRVPLALEAAAAGKSFVQTIPFALDLAQRRELRDRVAAGGQVAVLESLHRHDPAFRMFKSMLDQGVVGRLHTVRGQVRTDILFSPPPGWPYQWILYPENRSSALRNFGAHLLHTMVWLFGGIDTVAARIATALPRIDFTDGSTEVNGVADTAAMLLTFTSGVGGMIDSTWCTPGGEGFLIDAEGDAGQLRIASDSLGPLNVRVEFAAVGDPALRTIPLEARFLTIADAPEIRPDPAGWHGFAMAAMCHRLAKAVRGDEDADAGPTFDEAYHVMKVVEAGYLADRGKRWVAVDDVEPQA